MSKRIVMNLLADRPIAYHPDIARVAGGVKAGIFLSQLLYWSDKGKRGDGYIWKTQEEWETETALTRREQESARKTLKSKGLIDEKLQGIPAKLYYKINTDLLYDLLDELYVQTSMHESAILDVTEAPNSDAPKRQSITESTIDDTESTSSSPLISAYEQAFGTITYQAQQTLFDDDETYGTTAVIEAINIAKERGAKKYAYAAKVLDGKANDAQQASKGDAIWGEIQERIQSGRWNNLTPTALKIVQKCGGEAAFKSASEQWDIPRLKKQVYSYAQ